MTPARFFASGGGAGFSPVAPGTAGSFVGLGIGLAVLAVSPMALLPAAAMVTVCGVPAIAAAGRMKWRDKGADDPGWIVIDEIAGQMIALLALPRVSLGGAALAFAFFRLFDILKPGPVGWADRQGGAIAVMADDVIAGISAALVTRAILISVPALA